VTTLDQENYDVPPGCGPVIWRITKLEHEVESLYNAGAGRMNADRLAKLEQRADRMDETIFKVIALLLGNLAGIIALLASKLFQHGNH
jgi:hypothetical protein